jgi:hypothetical protein
MRNALLNMTTALMIGAGGLAAGSLAVQVAMPAPAQAASVVPDSVRVPCQQEDSNGCVWDARHMGNGYGDSFRVTRAGRVIYISHHRAHALLRGDFRTRMPY